MSKETQKNNQKNENESVVADVNITTDINIADKILSELEKVVEDHDNFVDEMVVKAPLEIEEEVEEAPQGHLARHRAVRNVFSPKGAKAGSNEPRISSPAQNKPHSVKSVLGTRTGAFKIDENRPIKN